ncbi:S-type pyocin family protein [Brevundimonas sp.]|uniref:S-type pyocin family protein n=1 Tax=Brevundimonas sp. TaxID=1871086 RepID=UPI0035AE4C73
MRVQLWGAVIGGALALAACDNGSSAVETRDRTGETASLTSAEAPAGGAASPRTADEKPIWTSNRRNSSAENLDRIYKRNGAAFGASDAGDFAGKAQAFIDAPPGGTETISRVNGDTLYYHAATNTFAVANREGVPRTMFKPDNGAAYWVEQKSRESERSARAGAADSEAG